MSEPTILVPDVTTMLDDIAALAPRAKAISERYMAAHQDRRAAEIALIEATIDLVVPYLSAITGWREEIQLRGVDLFPGHLIMSDEGQLYERSTAGDWLNAGPEAIQSKEVGEFLAALVDLLGRVVKGKAPAKTEEQQRIARRMQALTAIAVLAGD